LKIALIGLLIGFIGSMPLAGPIALLIFRKGSRGEYQEGAALALGATLPEAMYCWLAVLGFDYIFVHHPMVEPIARLAGAVLMVVLGLVFVFSKQKQQQTVTKLSGQRKHAAPFLTGFSISLLNPVLLMTWSGVVAVVYTIHGTFTNVEKVMFPIGVGAGIFLWFAVMLILMRWLHGRFRPSALDPVIRIFGIMMTLLGLWLLYGAIGMVRAASTT
jgi:threonine/homoserine/homoserine lactone efflux protein